MAKKEKPTTNPSNFQVLKDSPVKTVRQRFAEKTAPVYKSGEKKGQKRKDDWSPPAYPSSPIGAKPDVIPEYKPPVAGPALNPTGSNPLGGQPLPAPRTTSEGLPVGRRAGTTSTRGHGSIAEHVRQLEATANLLGVDTKVSTRGQIRGLSRNSPVEPPHPTLISHKGETTQVLYTNEYDRAAPVYRGQSPSSTDFSKWNVGGRPDLLDVVQQHQNIATPGGINRGPSDKVDTSRGARGEFSGMDPEQLQDAVKAEVLPDRINRAVSDLMRPEKFSRARNIQKPWGVGSKLTPAQQEKTDMVRVTKGKKTTTMTQAQHAERAKKRIAKRNKAEGGN